MVFAYSWPRKIGYAATLGYARWPEARPAKLGARRADGAAFIHSMWLGTADGLVISDNFFRTFSLFLIKDLHCVALLEPILKY